MSATFSFSRLGKLIAKQFYENSRLYLIATLALLGLLALAFTFWIIPGWYHFRQHVFQYVGKKR